MPSFKSLAGGSRLALSSLIAAGFAAGSMTPVRCIADDTDLVQASQQKPKVEIRLKLSKETMSALNAAPVEAARLNSDLGPSKPKPISIRPKPGIYEHPLVIPCLFDGEDRIVRVPARIVNPGKALPLAKKLPTESVENEAQTQTAELELTPPESVAKENEAAAPTEVQEKFSDSDETELALELSPSVSNRNAKSSSDDKAASPTSELDSVDASAPSEDSSRECPGAPSPSENGSVESMESHPDDIPLEQDDHPYDAPAAKSAPKETAPQTQVHIASPRELAIQTGINNCLKYFLDHPETVVRRGPWALMHASLPFGVESEVIAGNRRVNTIGWMCFNGVCAKQRMFQPTRTGFRTNVGPGVQGHEGQFLAILAQSRVQADYPIQIGQRRYTINDLVRYEMATCVEKSELTFKLIGLSYYLNQEQRWRDQRGHYWTLEKMVADELSQPVNGAACGGSHRLMGLSYAVIRRQQAGLPITGHWERAERYLNDYVNYAMTLQNPDGSFSTEWFEGRGQEPNVERKVQTTGHILEWLIYTLPDEHLRSPRIQLSVEYLLNTVGAAPERDWPIGPRGHALRALALYNERVFGALPGKMQAYIAETQNGPVLR